MSFSFISYSSHDFDFAVKIANFLTENGVKTWIDKKNIPFGSNWDREIEDALQKCENIIVILSPRSVESENVINEISYSLSKNKRIVPILFEECETPFIIHRIQQINFANNYEKGLLQLINTIKQNEPQKNIILSESNLKRRKLKVAFIAFAILVAFGSMCYAIIHQTKSDPNLGIIVSKFIEEGEDDFSYSLCSSLMSETSEMDTISIIKYDKPVNIFDRSRLDNLKKIFQSHGFARGLLVFGRRSNASLLFDCNIYFDNVLIGSEDSKFSNNNIVFIKNPDVISFSIDKQTEAICHFILGVLKISSMQYVASNVEIRKAIMVNGNEKNTKFLSYCYMLLGNSMQRMNQIDSSKNMFEKAIQLDSTNAFIHYNLASVYLSLSDSIKASYEFAKAHLLNNSFEIPIKPGLSGKSIPLPIALNKPLRSDTVRTPNKHFTSVDDRTKKNQKSEIANKEPIISAPHMVIPQVESKEFKIELKDDKYGVINKNGDVILPFIYSSIEEFIYKSKIYFIVSNDKKFGAVRATGKNIIPVNHQDAKYVKQILTMSVEVEDSKSNPNSIIQGY